MAMFVINEFNQVIELTRPPAIIYQDLDKAFNAKIKQLSDALRQNYRELVKAKRQLITHYHRLMKKLSEDESRGVDDVCWQKVEEALGIVSLVSSLKTLCDIVKGMPRIPSNQSVLMFICQVKDYTYPLRQYQDLTYQLEYVKESYDYFSAHQDDCTSYIQMLRRYDNVLSPFKALPMQFALKKNYLEWGLFIVGELTARTKLELEYHIASVIEVDEDLRDLLNAACQRVYVYIKEAHADFLTHPYQQISTYSYFLIPYLASDVLASPEAFSIHQCLCALYDFSHYLLKVDTANVYIAESDAKYTSPYHKRELLCFQSYTKEYLTRTVACSKRRMVCVNELTKPIMAARKHKVPLIFPSYTTARVLRVVKLAGGDKAMLEATALALFCFWKLKYWQNISPVHHYHFVMDMAANFGVDYKPFTYKASLVDKVEAYRQSKGPQFFKRPYKETHFSWRNLGAHWLDIFKTTLKLPLWSAKILGLNSLINQLGRCRRKKETQYLPCRSSNT